MTRDKVFGADLIRHISLQQRQKWRETENCGVLPVYFLIQSQNFGSLYSLLIIPDQNS